MRLRELRRSDGASWRAFRIADEHLLRPVEPTVATSWEEAHSPNMWRQTYRVL